MTLYNIANKRGYLPYSGYIHNSPNKNSNLKHFKQLAVYLKKNGIPNCVAINLENTLYAIITLSLPEQGLTNSSYKHLDNMVVSKEVLQALKGEQQVNVPYIMIEGEKWYKAYGIVLQNRTFTPNEVFKQPFMVINQDFDWPRLPLLYNTMLDNVSLNEIVEWFNSNQTVDDLLQNKDGTTPSENGKSNTTLNKDKNQLTLDDFKKLLG